jgi:nucleoid DNA-binding protein
MERWKNGMIGIKAEFAGATMNKKELVKRVAEKLGDLPQKTANKAVDAVFESIAEGLQEDGVVTIGKWGTYSAEDIAEA